MTRGHFAVTALLSWLAALALAWLCCFCLSGCKGQKQKAEAGRDVFQLEERKEGTIDVAGSARDVEMHGLSAEQLELEKARLQEIAMYKNQMSLLIVGLMLIFIVAESFIPAKYRPFFWFAGLACVVAGFVLPVVKDFVF